MAQYLFNENEAFEGYSQYLINSNKTFKIEQTGYSRTIIHDNNKSIYADDKINSVCFSMFSSLKKEIKNNDLHIDFVPEYDVKYYGISEIVSKKSFLMPSDIVNVDIKSAYLSVLKNKKIISEELFEKINKINKIDRLKTLGFLATNKVVLEYENGELINVTSKRNEYANYFFLCCYEIGELMTRIANEFNENFLFYWVDGIYFDKNNLNIERVTKIIDEYQFSYKVEHLTSANLEFREKTAIFSYLKEDKKKIITVPIEDKADIKAKKAYLKYLLNKKNANKIN